MKSRLLRDGFLFLWEVATLVNNEMKAGEYTIPFSAHGELMDGASRDLPTGIYFYRLEGGNLSETKKMVLLR